LPFDLFRSSGWLCLVLQVSYRCCYISIYPDKPTVGIFQSKKHHCVAYGLRGWPITDGQHRVQFDADPVGTIDES
jgi:hypothetical protein